MNVMKLEYTFHVERIFIFFFFQRHFILKLTSYHLPSSAEFHMKLKSILHPSLLHC